MGQIETKEPIGGRPVQLINGEYLCNECCTNNNQQKKTGHQLGPMDKSCLIKVISFYFLLLQLVLPFIWNMEFQTIKHSFLDPFSFNLILFNFILFFSHIPIHIYNLVHPEIIASEFIFQHWLIWSLWL